MTLAIRPSHRLGLVFPVLLLALAAGPAAAQTPRPIPGVEGWLLFDQLPGVERRACIARINGPEANTTVALNNDGLPLLIAGRPDWNHNLGETPITLSVDGGAPVPLQGGIVGNLVVTLIADGPLAQRLRAARTLDWTFPFGRFRANVAGLGTALDAVRACQGVAPA